MFPDLLDLLKDRQHPNLASVDDRFGAGVERARNVFIKTAAGDVDNRFDLDCIDEFEHRFDIQSGWGQQRLAQGGAVKLAEDIARFFLQLKHFADKREAVGMNAGGWQRDQHVARLHIFRIDHLALIDHAHAEAGKVVLVHRVETRHLGGLAADQRASRSRTQPSATPLTMSATFSGIFLPRAI